MHTRAHISLIPAAVIACIACSSFGRSISIDRRGLVHAIGIDNDESGYKVTMQIFQPTGGGADTAVDSTKPNITVAVSEGKTVGEALAAARSSTGKELFFGHLQLICLGRDVQLGDPYELFAFALGDKNISPAASLCMAEDTAAELMEIRLSEEEISSEALNGLLEVSSEYSETVPCNIIRLLNSDGMTAMPMLKANGEEKDSSSEDNSTEVSRMIKLAGTAVTGSDTLLDARQSMAAAMLCGQAEKAYLVTDIGSEEITSALEDISTRPALSIKDGKMLLTTHITLTARPDRQLDSRKSTALADAVSSRLEHECEQLQIKMLSRGEDIFGTKQLIKHSYPQIWLQNADAPDKLLNSLGVSVKVSVKVD